MSDASLTTTLRLDVDQWPGVLGLRHTSNEWEFGSSGDFGTQGDLMATPDVTARRTTTAPRVFTAHRHRAGHAHIVEMRGDLDVENTATARACIDAALGVSRFVIVDLGAASFLDCHAVGALVASAGRARQRGGWLRAADLSQPARRVFDAFDLYPTLGGQDSVAALCAGLAGSEPPEASRPVRRQS